MTKESTPENGIDDLIELKKKFKSLFKDGINEKGDPLKYIDNLNDFFDEIMPKKHYNLNDTDKCVVFYPPGEDPSLWDINDYIDQVKSNDKDFSIKGRPNNDFDVE